MKPGDSPPMEEQDELSALIRTLHKTEQRLEELTGGEVDTVSSGSGQPFVLRRAQAQLRHNDAAKQNAILNALPAHIAMLDATGTIISVNEAWRRFGRVNAVEGPGYGVGLNYLDVCDRSRGNFSGEAHRVAAGIRAVLTGAEPGFSIEYPCHSPTEQRWFLLIVTPLAEEHLHGAVVMHLNITERRRAVEELRESEERFAGAFELAPIGMALVTPTGRWLKVNRALCDLIGYTETEMLARTFQDMTHPEDIAADLEFVRQLLAGELRSYQMEKRYIHTQGHAVTVLLNVSLVRDDLDQPLYFIAQIQDITERKRLEARLRRLVDSDAQAVIFWNTKGEITDANDAFLRLSRYTREDLKAGRINWVAMTPAEYAPLDQHALEELDVSGVCATYEKEWIRADGSRVPILLGAAMFQDNPDDGVCFVLDLTERRKSEKALRASKEQFKALFDQAAVGVAQADATTGRFVRVNQRFCDIAGRSREELEELTFAAISHPDEAERDQERMRRLRAGLIRESTREKRYVRKDGTEVWVNVTVSAMWAPGEAPGLCVAIVQDITERKKLEDQIRQTQKMDAIGTLAGGIAHDFNNILAAINGYTQLAQMKLKDNPEVLQHLGAVRQAAGRAAGLVRQILTFSSQQPQERRPIQLQPVVVETFDLLRATIPSTIEFDLDLAADAPTVLADATQIHQILMNLGTNAWHAMKDRPGRLQVKLERFTVDAEFAATSVRLRPGLYARLSVSDTGTGMDQATQKRIFEPFFTTKAPGQGTGLGLSVVHGIMDNHDGVITVYSEPGQGTVFHLYFPAHAGEAIMTQAEEARVPHGRGERILVVDDEETLAQLGRKTLVALGYEVEVTTQPAAALALVRSDPTRYALIVTDQTMPGMTGVDLAAQLRLIRPDLPVILMTGYAASLAVEQAGATNVRQVLLKPATVHALASAVQAALVPQPPAVHGQNSPD